MTSNEDEAVEAAARVGLAARGATYLLVGGLGLLVALHREAAPPNRQGALQLVAAQPLGRALVALLAVGFAAFALWRLAEAVRGDKWGQRIGNVGRAALYVGFFVTALPFVLHGSKHRSKEHEVDVTARVLGWPGGRLIVIAAGLAVVAAGLWNGYRALAQRYRKKLKWREMGKDTERVVRTVATAGLVGRMAAFTLVGAFVVKAGWQYQPSDAGGLDVALHHLLDARFGPALVALVGLGLVVFGGYSFVEARYREIPRAS
ncbi:MAG: DUF1206 domain-containing protein [Actinobacteria bacterium]|nr:DUF1206 domain-containing protein [Actinomycetota bacterium]